MTWSLTLNGTDLASLGFYLKEVGGGYDAPDREIQTLSIRGRAGNLLSPPIRESGRVITLTGTLTSSAKTVVGRSDAEDALKDKLRAGLLRLARTDSVGSVWFIEGMFRSIKAQPIGHPVNPTDDYVTLTMVSRDAYYRDVEPTILAFGSTRVSMPLGTAPSSPIIRLIGAATNPVLSYRDAGGTVQRSMTFTASLAGTNDWLDIDMRYGKIVLWASGVASNGRSLLTSGDFPWALDTHDGDFATASWPTLDVTSGNASVLYWAQWL